MPTIPSSPGQHAGFLLLHVIQIGNALDVIRLRDWRTPKARDLGTGRRWENNGAGEEL